jgi:hypothetical protein
MATPAQNAIEGAPLSASDSVMLKIHKDRAIQWMLAFAAVVTLGILLLQQVTSVAAHTQHIDDTLTEHTLRLDRMDTRMAEFEHGQMRIENRLGVSEESSR